MSEEEKKAIETLKEVASDNFDTLGDDISPKMAQNILNVINKQQKEIEERETRLQEEINDNCRLKNELYVKFVNSISKDKIREKQEQLMEIGWNDKEERQMQNFAYDILKQLLEEN